MDVPARDAKPDVAGREGLQTNRKYFRFTVHTHTQLKLHVWLKLPCYRTCQKHGALLL